jgi:hypothetical protein
LKKLVHPAIINRKQRAGLRREVHAKLDAALDADDLVLAKQLKDVLKELAPKSNGRSSSSECRDPFHPELLAIYRNKLVHEILAEYGKEIRVDFGFRGMVAGIAAIVAAASEAAGEPLSSALVRELTRRFSRKIVERTHGMGALYVERGNQILRKLYEHPQVVSALGLPTGDRPWLRRRPLADQAGFDTDFARRWTEFETQGVDAEDFVGDSATDGVSTDGVSTESDPSEGNGDDVADAKNASASDGAKTDDDADDKGKTDDGKTDDGKTDDVGVKTNDGKTTSIAPTLDDLLE